MISVKVFRRPDGDYTYRCGRLINGLYWQAVGCQHLVPREAARHADSLEPGTPPAPQRVVPPDEFAVPMGSPDPARPLAQPLASLGRVRRVYGAVGAYLPAADCAFPSPGAKAQKARLGRRHDDL